MAEGDVPGVYVIIVEVPQSGSLEFQFLIDGDQEQVLGPAIPNCTRKTEAIIGPQKKTQEYMDCESNSTQRCHYPTFHSRWETISYMGSGKRCVKTIVSLYKPASPWR